MANLDPLAALVQLSNRIGQDPRLVQPGGGNTSVKLDGTLLVKGSGTDLRTIGPDGFTRLSLARLDALAEAESMSDAEMMRFMAGCMLGEGPAPSVETPLHSLLPHRVVAHTHDVATMSLTNVPDATAERLVGELFEGGIVYVPYTRPGFPLARAVGQMVGRIPERAIGLALAHHGLVVWGDDAEEAERRLRDVVARIDEFIAASRRGRQVLGAVRSPAPSAEERRRLAEIVLPAVRGALAVTGASPPYRPAGILHFDDAPDILATLAAERLPEVAARGMATPEHILRAGRLPVRLDLDLAAPPDALAERARSQIASARAEYEEYHRRHAGPDGRPLDDWAKVVLVPGLGLITAFSDKRSAVTANLCYRATLEAIAGAEAVDRFQFLEEADVFEFEHWPLERRKVEEALARERATKELPRHVVVVIGGGSGIGRAAARRFAEEGAHVVVSDLEAASAEAVAAELAPAFPGRVLGVGADVRSDASLDVLIRRAVLEFGGLDCHF
jgi:rhamnose utilization protein RhaD (predicted bifunctional aldolase and dehydrogenase)